jgi:hypothetical protein
MINFPLFRLEPTYKISFSRYQKKQKIEYVYSFPLRNLVGLQKNYYLCLKEIFKSKFDEYGS